MLDKKQSLENLLTTRDVAHRLGISGQWLRQLVIAGKLNAYHTRLGYLYEPTEIEQFKRERAGRSEAADAG